MTLGENSWSRILIRAFSRRPTPGKKASRGEWAAHGDETASKGPAWHRQAGRVVTLVWSALATYLIVMGVRAWLGLRVSEDDEVKGLDITTHGESGYRL